MTEKTGTLYVIGIGPGDPELLTLKAARIIKNVPYICVPKGREEGSSLALSIVTKIIDLTDKEIIEAYFPMKKTRTTEHINGLEIKWQETVENLIRYLNKGSDVVFLTLGDPSIYSTFFYLYERLLKEKPELKITIIPGVSSITAAAAAAGEALGLGDEKIAILPATYVDNLEDTLQNFETVVLMKVNKELDQIINVLDKLGLIDKTTYISRLGMDGEIVTTDIKGIKTRDMNYFSLMIVKK